MYMKVSDILDRWTILKMKARYDETSKKELALYDAEISTLIAADAKALRPGETSRTTSLSFLSIIADLMEANAKTWENESAIRNEYLQDPANNCKMRTGKERPMSLEEIGKRALAIREHNKQRVAAKAKIDQLFGQLPDRKIDHASE